MKRHKLIIAGLGIFKSIFKVKVLKRRIPIYCEWEVTSHCNMKCGFCSTWISNRNQTVDVSTQEALDIIEQLAKLGTKIIHFTGGEPTLRDDLPQLVKKAREKNMIVAITTNGSASSEKLGQILNADLIRVSIDGPEQFHDSLRKTPGAFKKAVETLHFLRTKNLKPQITTVYTRQSDYEMLEELCDIAKESNIQISINILDKNINDNSVNNPREDFTDLSSAFFSEYMNVVARLRKKYANVIANPEPLITIIVQGGLDVFGCRAMDIAIAIKHDGALSLPCNALSLIHSKGELKGIFYSQEASRMRFQQGRHPACKGCHIRCMCSASALLKVKGLAVIVDSYIRSLF